MSQLDATFVRPQPFFANVTLDAFASTTPTSLGDSGAANWSPFTFVSGSSNGEPGAASAVRALTSEEKRLLDSGGLSARVHAQKRNKLDASVDLPSFHFASSSSSSAVGTSNVNTALLNNTSSNGVTALGNDMVLSGAYNELLSSNVLNLSNAATLLGTSMTDAPLTATHNHDNDTAASTLQTDALERSMLSLSIDPKDEDQRSAAAAALLQSQK